MPAKTVFISYSHDSPEHTERVADLAASLRQDGLNCLIDRYVENNPPKGWPIWSEEALAAADFVLVVCSERYLERVYKNAPPGEGLGATWEAHLIYQHLYESGADGGRFVPVIFRASDNKFIPGALRSGNHYLLDDKAGYDRLCEVLMGRRRPIPPLGAPKTPPFGLAKARFKAPKPAMVGYLGLAMALLGAVFAAYLIFPANPTGSSNDWLSDLEGRGFTVNPGLAASFHPGDIIQIAEADGKGNRRALPGPVLFHTRADCFPDLLDRRAPYRRASLVHSAESSGAETFRLLPRLRLDSPVARQYSIEFHHPELRAISKGEISEAFSAKCLESFQRVVKAGGRLEWYAAVIETIEAESFDMVIEWKGRSDAEAIDRVINNSRDSLPSVGLSQSFRSDGAAVIQADGPFMLAYRHRPLEGVY